jgi:hypothetical protein
MLGKTHSVRFLKKGLDSIRVSIIVPNEFNSIALFNGFKTEFEECSRFRWSINRGFSDTDFARAYQNANLKISQNNETTLVGEIETEVFLVDVNCPSSKNFKCSGHWNSSFVMKRIDGFVLLASILNNAQINSGKKAPAVARDEVNALEEVLIDLETRLNSR